ncbi:hypothetical protein O0L34_g9887 [Tuta absoluta]|nr:hypothetical protein O0L34_g9887 [Tuta absoluta]
MFVAPENTKKRFQKPNILRKRAKPPPKPSISAAHESLSVKSLVTTSTMQEPKLQLDKISLYKQCPTKSTQPIQRVFFEKNNEDSSCMAELYQIDGNVETDRSLAVTCDVLTNNNDDVFESTVNVESFINNSDMEQLVFQADIDSDLRNRIGHGWCLDFINNDSHQIIIENIDRSQIGSLRLAPPPAASHTAPVTSSPAKPKNITLEYMNCTMNFKCDIQNCSKWFRSEEALKKHKNTHTKPAKAINKDKPVVIECPVTKVHSNGFEKKCGVVCSNRKDIIKHFNDCHDPEDAMYICDECGRRFYWAAGLRAHSRYHTRKTLGEEPWKCTWPDCGRSFRQPCRLREHMRAHTGDKPYPCRYPNCGWSFRTASKLLRHARRHTGERRHQCGECGRAFRRREHLRDHIVRHRHKHTDDEKKSTLGELTIHCEGEGAGAGEGEREGERGMLEGVDVAAREVNGPEPQETFVVNLDSPTLTGHTLAEVESLTPPQTTTETISDLTFTEPIIELAIPDTELVLEMPEAETELVDSEPEVGSPRAARTHCTWPFPVRAPQIFEENANQEYVLEEDVQVEMCSGSESNIYTIKSDLFLHGNVHNEDSEQMCSTVSADVIAGVGEGREVEGEERDETPLSLLDAHPTIDLMQEELLYTDAAVDESSFRVFMLSGEELS